jgi:RNA-directed DNA polymerase
MIVKEIKINEKTQKNSAQNLMWRTLNDSLRLSAIISRGFSSESGNKNQKNGWHEIDWKKAEKTIKNLQEKIVIATLDNNFKEVYRQQWILIRSVEAQSVAIRRVITNKGGKTAGTDGVVWTDPQEYLEAVRKLSCIIKDNKNYEAQPLRRVNIPKGNGEVIPLGIPTMMDRAVQALYHLGVDPVVETQSDPNSYGFRKNRSAHDAITAIRNHLDKDNHPRWVLEADIPHRGKISHEFLLKHTPILHKNVLEQWLKAGIMEELNHIETTEGTPQGGIISPTLCNVALNGVEKAIGKANPNKRGISAGVHVIRYADDLIITSKSKEIAFKNKDILSEFLNERGLTLSNKKTRITHVKEGFDFLGFNIRRSKLNLRLNKITEQETVLIIKPREKSIAKLKNSLKRIIIMHKPLEKIVAEANPY